MISAPLHSAPLTACYISGKGMHAHSTTWGFKTTLMLALPQQGLGFDTRLAYYQQQFPNKDAAELARMVCDPIEYYDRDWPAWCAKKPPDMDQHAWVTRFFLQRDRRFQQQAELAIMCFDEAGLGSGINAMRFLQAGKPLIGCYNQQRLAPHLNLDNVMQLQQDFPDLVNLFCYHDTASLLNGCSQALRVYRQQQH